MSVLSSSSDSSPLHVNKEDDPGGVNAPVKSKREIRSNIPKPIPVLRRSASVSHRSTNTHQQSLTSSGAATVASDRPQSAAAATRRPPRAIVEAKAPCSGLLPKQPEIRPSAVYQLLKASLPNKAPFKSKEPLLKGQTKRVTRPAVKSTNPTRPLAVKFVPPLTTKEPDESGGSVQPAEERPLEAQPSEPKLPARHITKSTRSVCLRTSKLKDGLGPRPSNTAGHKPKEPKEGVVGDQCLETSTPFEEPLQWLPDLENNSPLFLKTFQDDVGVFLDSWFLFITRVLSDHMQIGQHALTRTNHKSRRHECYQFVARIPTKGDSLKVSIQKMEEDFSKVIATLFQNVMVFWRDYEGLRSKHFWLENQHKQLNSELEILGEENKTLDQKYTTMCEKYKNERAKCDGLEKNILFLNGQISGLNEKIKEIDRKCVGWQGNMDNFEGQCQIIEYTVKSESLVREKENKEFLERFSKYTDLLQDNDKLNADNAKQNEEITTLTTTKGELQQKINDLKASLQRSMKKEKNLIQVIDSNNKKITSLEAECKQFKKSKDSNKPEVVATEQSIDLMKEILQRNNQIQELSLNLTKMENNLKEKCDQEEYLMKQIDMLKEQCSYNSNGAAVQSQISALTKTITDLTDEKCELEMMLAQKTNNLDISEGHYSLTNFSQDDIFPAIQNKQRDAQNCIARIQARAMEVNQPSSEHVAQAVNALPERMAEAYGLQEQKLRHVMRLERRIQELQGLSDMQ